MVNATSATASRRWGRYRKVTFSKATRPSVCTGGADATRSFTGGAWFSRVATRCAAAVTRLSCRATAATFSTGVNVVAQPFGGAGNLDDRCVVRLSIQLPH